MSYRFADSLRAGSGRNSVLILLASRNCNLYDIYHCCVYSEKLPMMDTGTLGNMQSSISKNKFEKLVNLVGFILTMSRPFRFVTKNLYLRPISPRCATLYTHLPGVLHSTHISQVCYTLHTSPRCATLYTHLPGVLHSTHISQVCYTIHTSPPAGLIAVKLI